MWLIGLLWGCGTPDCGPAECADVCAQAVAPDPEAVEVPAPASGLSAFEKQMFDPLLEDLRQGVRPFNAQGIGICSMKGRECIEYLGKSVESLPPGEYMLRAELRVPDAGPKGTWSVTLHTECVTTKTSKSGETSSTKTNSNTYGDLIYAGAERGYRLQPLVKITSPYPYGDRDCKYKLTAPHPDGDKVYSGSWRVPGKQD